MIRFDRDFYIPDRFQWGTVSRAKLLVATQNFLDQSVIDQPTSIPSEMTGQNWDAESFPYDSHDAKGHLKGIKGIHYTHLYTIFRHRIDLNSCS